MRLVRRRSGLQGAPPRGAAHAPQRCQRSELVEDELGADRAQELLALGLRDREGVGEQFGHLA